MIIDELKNDLEKALSKYIQKFAKSTDIPIERKLDIIYVKKTMQSKDALQICKTLNEYLKIISIPFLSWLPLDINRFIVPLQEILQKEKYQEVNFLRTLLKEKEKIIEETKMQCRNNCSAETPNFLGERIKEILVEMQLLKSENVFLYQTLAKLETKISVLEKLHKDSQERAMKAEVELKYIKESIEDGRENFDVNQCSFKFKNTVYT